MTCDFERTRKALARFDREMPAIIERWKDVGTSEDVQELCAAEAKLRRVVQGAFWVDTHEFNSKSACMVADIGFIRRIAECRCSETEKGS